MSAIATWSSWNVAYICRLKSSLGFVTSALPPLSAQNSLASPSRQWRESSSWTSQGRHPGPPPALQKFLGPPQPPVAVVELLDEPGQPPGARLGHHHAQLRVPLENAPGE